MADGEWRMERITRARGGAEGLFFKKDPPELNRLAMSSVIASLVVLVACPGMQMSPEKARILLPTFYFLLPAC